MKLLVVQCDKTSWLALATTKPHFKCVPAALFPGIRWPESEPNHSPLSDAEVKNEKICTSASYIPSWRAQEQLYSALLLNLSMYFFLLLFFVRYLYVSGSKVLNIALSVWYTLGYSYCSTGIGCSSGRFRLALGGTKFIDIFLCSASNFYLPFLALIAHIRLWFHMHYTLRFKCLNSYTAV